MQEKMKFVTAITTYQRLDYLKRCVESWDRTRDKNHEWMLIIADDGSSDGTLVYLENLFIPDVEVKILKFNRRGVHHLSNQILNLCSKLRFDFGFMTDDDIVYIAPGWDNAYFKAARETGFWHLVFFDMAYSSRGDRRKKKSHSSDLLISQARFKRVQGVFWTLTQDIIKKVGYFDLQNFGLCFLGHIDYSRRCSFAGFNNPKHIFDIKESNNFIRLETEDYKGAITSRQRVEIMNSKKERARKFRLINKKRGYVPNNELNIDMNLKKINSQ